MNLQLRNLFTVSVYTFIEIFRSRIIYNVLLIGMALLLISFITSEFTYGVPGKVALDIGLGSLSLVSVGIALFFGATLVKSEINNRTIYMALSRPGFGIDRNPFFEHFFAKSIHTGNCPDKRGSFF
jgi:ABC-type transport system involved in multi-copper enzyme maturation permease subunit